MTKKELERELKNYNRGSCLITMTIVMSFLGKGQTYTRELLRGLDSVGAGRNKMYYVGDVVDRILQRVCQEGS